MNNKTAKNLINEVFEIHGKKTNDINLLYKLRNNIVSITPKISNQEIIRELRKSRAHLTEKIKKTKMRLKGSNNNIFSKIRRLATIQKTKTNNIEELEKLLKEKNRIENSLKKNHNYTDNSIKNLLKNIKNKWGNDTNSAYLTFSIIKEEFNSQKRKKVQNNSLEKKQARKKNLETQREKLYKLKEYMPENKKNEFSTFLKQVTDKISGIKKGIKKMQNNNMNNNTNAIGMLLEQQFKRNNPNINNIQSVSTSPTRNKRILLTKLNERSGYNPNTPSIKRLKPGKYKITKNNITKL
jgi:DNA repair exonuclease SbcCD ATPase subunit